jgi:hypothetical protein
VGRNEGKPLIGPRMQKRVRLVKMAIADEDDWLFRPVRHVAASYNLCERGAHGCARVKAAKHAAGWVAS